MMKLKIFISSYACEPNLGSEIGVGWHWVLEMSKYFEIWVLTRKSNKSSIEAWIKDNPTFSNINFIYFDLPYYLRFWKKGLRGVRIYYNIWQLCTNSIVKNTMQENDIKIFHHLTYGNALWTVSKYGQKQFFVWGPTGGVDTIPFEFSKYYNFKGRLIEFVRRSVVSSLKFNTQYNKRCSNANLILCKTENFKSNIAPKYRDKAILFTDVAVDKLILKESSTLENANVVKYITVGKLDPWRGFDLLIEAFAIAINVNPNIHLEIIGKGLDCKRLEKIIAEKSLQRYVDLVGEVSMNDYYKRMSESDVVVNAALKEGAVTTSFDSMAMGKPLICVDTKGYTRYFSNDYAIVIPQQNRINLINSLSDAVLKLTDSTERVKLGSKANNVGNKFSWDERGKEIYHAITESYNKYNS